MLVQHTIPIIHVSMFQTPSYDRLVHLDVTSQQGGMYGGAGASVSYHIPHLPHLSYQIRVRLELIMEYLERARTLSE